MFDNVGHFIFFNDYPDPNIIMCKACTGQVIEFHPLDDCSKTNVYCCSCGASEFISTRDLKALGLI